VTRRVAVTGMGLVTPLGNDVASTWAALIAGESGAGPITRFDSALLPVHFALGPDGALWFAENTANKIGRITTGGVITEFLVPTAASAPFDITSGPDGSLWFTERAGNRIGRITTGAPLPPATTPVRVAPLPVPTPNSSDPHIIPFR